MSGYDPSLLCSILQIAHLCQAPWSGGTAVPAHRRLASAAVKLGVSPPGTADWACAVGGEGYASPSCCGAPGRTESTIMTAISSAPPAAVQTMAGKSLCSTMIPIGVDEYATVHVVTVGRAPDHVGQHGRYHHHYHRPSVRCNPASAPPRDAQRRGAVGDRRHGQLRKYLAHGAPALLQESLKPDS